MGDRRDETDGDRDLPALVEERGALEELVERFEGETELAFDLEGDGLYRYRSQLCVVQLATRAGEMVAIDTLAVTHREPLARLLGPEGPRKTVHDVSYDARLLAENDITLGHVFDTSVAARFLGEPKTGLAGLVEKYFEVKLPKGQQNADWGRRPLSNRDLQYLGSDVRFLLELGDALERAVREAELEPEVRTETEYLLHRALTDEPDPRPPWARIKGRDDLDEAELAVLREVAEVREKAAQKADVPPFKIVGNRQLLEMAKARPATRSELADIPGAAKGRARRHGSAFLDAIRRGESAERVPDDERALAFPEPPPREERDRGRRLRKALSKWRTSEAESRGVDRQVVLPGHCLEDLATRRPASREELDAIPGFGEHRTERYGEALLEILAKG